MHVTYQSRDQAAVEIEADFAVVGSGPGGSAAAVVLARAGYRVAIIEAGPWRAPDDYPSSSYGLMRDLFVDWGTLSATGRAILPILQAACVGGSAVVNSAILVRTPYDCFERWEREYGIPAAEFASRVLAHEERIERDLHAEVVPKDALGRSNLLALEGARALGVRVHMLVRAVSGCEGTGQCFQGCRNGRKQSPNVNYVPEVLERNGYVLSSAPASRVVFDRRRAVAVTGQFRDPATRRLGARFLVRSRRGVLLAASPTRTPILLAQSGFRSPALGSLFRAHPGAGVFGVYDAPVDHNVGTTQGFGSSAFRVEPGFKLETLAVPPEMVMGRLPGGGRRLVAQYRQYRHLASWVVAVRAESAGTVKPGWFGMTDIRYDPDDADMRRFRAGLATLARLHFAAGARAVIPGIHGLPDELGPDDVKRIDEAPIDPRYYVPVLSHLFGGCPMHRDPARGVVDANGKVHGAGGLYIVDASAIPTTLGVNPQHTIMGLSAAWAERIAEERRPGEA